MLPPISHSFPALTIYFYVSGASKGLLGKTCSGAFGNSILCRPRDILGSTERPACLSVSVRNFDFASERNNNSLIQQPNEETDRRDKRAYKNKWMLWSAEGKRSY